MPLVIRIPDGIVEAIKIPQNRIERELIKEFSFFLYEKGFATMGVARKLSGLSKWEFMEGLPLRGIERHYTQKELEEDLRYAKGNK